MRRSILLCAALLAACAGTLVRSDVPPDRPQGAAAARDAELAKLYTAFADIHSNFNPALTRDGQRVIFSSTRDGLPQLYIADASQPRAAATRLTTTAERIFAAEATHDGKSIVYLSDKGADENWSLYRMPLAGGEAEELTAGETLSRDPPLLPEGMPDTLFFSARQKEDPASSLWMLKLEPGSSPRHIYGEPGTGFLQDVSRDGKWGLWVHYPTNTENTVLLVDMATGTARTLYPQTGAVQIQEARFSPDGRHAYVATDAGGEQTLLLKLDAATGAELARYRASAPVNELRVSPGGKLIAVGLAAGDHGELRLLTTAALKPRTQVRLPLGSWPVGIGLSGLGAFTPDGNRLVFGWSTPEVPIDLYSVSVQTGAVSPLRQEPRPTLKGLAGIRTEITHAPAHDGQKIPLIVYRPAKAGAKKLPVIVAYHGGPASVATVQWSAPVRFFLSQGYAWVAPNVRGSGGFGRAFEMADNGPQRLEAFKDIESAGRWAARQSWADPQRLVIYGGSYGGYTVLIGLTRQADLWRAGVDIFGVASVVSLLETTTGVIREIFKLEFGDLEKDREFLESISPIHDADKIADPLFVYAGANDPRVPRSESDKIVEALRQRSVPVEYMVAANEGHSLSRKENQIELYSRVARFLETALGK